MAQLSNPSKLALQKLHTLGEVHHPRTAKDVHKGSCIYLIYNGSNVLQLGMDKGKGDRLKKCMRGGLAGKHNKAFICAIGELVLGQPNNYAYVLLPPDRVKEAEKEIHKSLGIETNKQGATLVAGIEDRSIPGIHQALWTLAKNTDRYKALDLVEQQMAEELFELVTYATIMIQRRNRVVSSCQGDNLEGNILKKIDRSYLTNVLIQLTDEYLRYKSHRMKPEEFENFKRSYHPYIPRGEPFVLQG